MNTVVGYKPRKTQTTGVGGVDELQRKPRLAGGRRSTDEQGTRTDKHTRSVHASR